MNYRDIIRKMEASHHYARLARGEVLSSGVTGAISELIVCADLLRRGFAVFRAVAQSCPCDIAVVKDGKVLRIEVTTGVLSPNGKLMFAPHDSDNYDVLAVVVNGTITYKPEIQ